MTVETRLARAVNRLAVGTRVIGMREYDSKRAKRNGSSNGNDLEEAVTRLEAAADGLWEAVTK